MNRHFRLIENFITQSEHDIIWLTAQKKLLRVMPQYQTSHMDKVITNYRESQFSNSICPTFNSVTNRIKVEGENWMNRKLYWLHPHLLDLHGEGSIKPHIDSTESSGDLIMSLSMGTSTEILFKHKETGECVTINVPKNSLYMQRASVRYDWTHEIPYRSERIQRISLILRNIKYE